ncbi:transporter substrate-binding domain-containing protein [Butyrivibrio sp. AE3009]|uniref:transporter substrate-binding domain-containing protein n=1 Tax=Butyrivibrio sp. AE3009 TaxID=1280666 RepID=UPI0003B5F5A0|nr:transporter substrate-binding domain-containing protein [Butyrivibrio sp. AE3009]
MKKNLLTIALSTVLGAAALTGCGSTNTASIDEAEVAKAASPGSSVVYRTVDEIKESGTINIGVFSDKSPFGYVDENGNYAGYDVYFAERIGADLGVKINYVSTEAANRIEYLQTGKVDIILANFTVTEERAQEIDFALPYMNVALGVVSPSDAVLTSLEDVQAQDQIIVISGTTAETYLEKNYPDIKLQKYDAYAEAKTAFENGNAIAWANDNTEVIAFAIENEGFTVGIPSLGDADTIAPAVTKGNESLLNWLNDEIVAIGEENFFHADYEATLLDTYGADYENTLVVEGGKVQ